MPTATQVVEGLWQIKLGPVNAFLLDSGQGDPLDAARGELTLIDTGMPDSTEKVVAAIESTGRKVTDLKHIIVTHCHADHARSVAALKRMSRRPSRRARSIRRFRMGHERRGRSDSRRVLGGTQRRKAAFAVRAACRDVILQRT
jgi:glyoxylase-like metal-dependent hydrolase (beta-lactamase superfamily II)